MSRHRYFDAISFASAGREIAEYSKKDFRCDLSSGLAVALLTLPQAMAYAFVAGLPISCALFAAIFSSMVAALFGSSRHLVVGPSNAIAILIQNGTAQILANYFPEARGMERDVIAMLVVSQMTLLVGVMHLLAVGFKLGRLTQFVSHSVVIGYIAGAALTIVVSQLYVLMGIQPEAGQHSVFEKAVYLFSHLRETHLTTLLIGIGSLLMLIILKKKNRKIPAGVLTFLLAGIVVYGLRDAGVMVVGQTEEMSELTPQFAIPYFNPHLMNDLIPISFAVALLSILETVSVAKSIAASSGQRLTVNQEILGLGLGNLTSAFVGAMPISGSASRTGVNYESGARTRFSAVFAAVIVGMIVWVFGYFVGKIPLPALAALLLITAGGIIKKHQLLMCLKSTRSDAFVFWLTFLSAAFFTIDMAFYIGVMVSITLYLKKSAVPQLLQYTIDDSDKFTRFDPQMKPEKRKIRVIKVKGELFFGAADLFQTALKSIAEDDTETRVIILQLKNARDIDATVCLTIHQLYDYLKGTGRDLILSGLTLPVWEILSDSGLVEKMGKEHLFMIDERNPQLYMKKAVNKAKELAKESSAVPDGIQIRLDPPVVDQVVGQGLGK